MGFLKKITRPISRALDKIIPNEVKPALPFLAAAAPFMAPGLMGLGGNTMLSRALMSGGLNLGAQLAQEGSEGDFSGLSTLMAAATGALSTPGSAGGRTLPDGSGGSYSQVMGGDKLASTGTQSAGDFFKNKALGMDPGFAKSGLGALETSSNYLSGVSDTLQNNLFSMEGLKAALIPIGQGTTDLAVAENRRAQKDYDREMADYEAGIDSENSNRAFAIRQSMEAYGFTEQEILDAIEAAGYRAGGRVGFEFGGIPAAVESVEEKPKEFLVDKLKVTVQPGQSEQMAIMNAMMNDIDEVMPEDRKMEFYKLYLPQLRASGEISEKEYQGLMGELFGEGKAEGGRIGFDNGGFEPFKYTSKIPRVFKEDPFGSDPLGQILNMSYTVRAPLIDIIRTVAKTATEATKLAAAAVKLGYDVTEPVREAVGDVAGGIYDIAKKSVQESGDASRFIQPTYYLERFGPEKNLTDDETRLKRLKRSIGRDDRDLIKTIENRIFAYDDAGMNQNEEDKKVSNKIQTKIDERNFGFADGGLMNLGGREMDMRTGGFIPIGKKERADDVPARLSKNEFVMTADAVRAAGGGSVNEGARRMYNLMNNLEARV
jgi:hypothetical protein